MTVNKDELRELIESDLFGEGAYSLDDLLASESKVSKKPAKKEEIKEPTVDQADFLSADLSINEVDEQLLGEEIESIKRSSLPPVMEDISVSMLSDPLESDLSPVENQEALEDADTIIAEEEQSLEAFFNDVEKQLDSVEQEVFELEPEEPEDIPLIEVPPVVEHRDEPALIDEPVEQKRIDLRPITFPELEERISGQSFDLGFFSNIPVKIDVYLGDTTISLGEVYDLTEGSIIPLDKHFGEPLELRINGQTIAKGDVVAVDQHYGIMIKDIMRPALNV